MVGDGSNGCVSWGYWTSQPEPVNDYLIAQSVRDRAEKQRVLSSSPSADNTWEVCWLGGRGSSRTPSEYCQHTLAQGTKPSNAHMGSCNETLAPSGLYLHPEREKEETTPRPLSKKSFY